MIKPISSNCASHRPQLFPTLYGLWGFNLTRAQCHTAQPLAERMLRLAQRGRDAALLLQAHHAALQFPRQMSIRLAT